MKYRMVILLIIISLSSQSAGTDVKTLTVDTVPPQVIVLPENRYQNEAFYFTLKSNEDGQVFYDLDLTGKFVRYTKPVTIMKDGKTEICYYAEDLVGNRSELDTTAFILDNRPPELTVTPEPGKYKKPVFIELSSNESCRFYRQPYGSDKKYEIEGGSFLVNKRFKGYFLSEDRAGNRTKSGLKSYVVDTSRMHFDIYPDSGFFNSRRSIKAVSKEGIRVYYTFNPSASVEKFKPLKDFVKTPYGITLARFIGKDESGNISDIFQTTYVVDTAKPEISLRHIKGSTYDIVKLKTRKVSEIRYVLNPDSGVENGTIYNNPIKIPRKGRFFIKAQAGDKAGNSSEIFKWEYKYDTIPPVVTPSSQGGKLYEKFTLYLKVNEPSKIFYTLNNSFPDSNSLIYNRNGIVITRKGKTVIRYRALDMSGNWSGEDTLVFEFDNVPPVVDVNIDGDISANRFEVRLISNEPSRIYYETGGADPSLSSDIYTRPINMKSGQVLKYFAIDKAGNRSEQFVMNELKKPLVKAVPEGGVYNSSVSLDFETNIKSDVFWRILPDSSFRPVSDKPEIKKEGVYTLEYYSESAGGLKSGINRESYIIDWTPPGIEISLRKGGGDSLIVFFNSNENATVYYTEDGSNPLVSSSTKIAGNKFTTSSSRITVERKEGAKLVFYGEDAAANQSNLSVVDIFKPHVIPNVPEGAGRVYNHIISVSLGTYNRQSKVYFERHGRVPTMESDVFSDPITLLQSDTIIAFVVDPTGYKGPPDTLIYMIDLPPSVKFTSNPDTADINTKVSFNASETIDKESSNEQLEFFWDLDGDSLYEVSGRGIETVRHTFQSGGYYHPVLKVVDPAGNSSVVSRPLIVRGRCPQGMVFVPMPSGHSFCIDRYEWPNEKGRKPDNNISWIKAKMKCLDAGKRLCTQEEWEYTCSGGEKNNYPYGNEYKPGRCPVDGNELFRSGRFSDCKEGFGTRDMVGNVWEWVDKKNSMFPLLYGGAYNQKERAGCGIRSSGNIIESYRNVGFRCCK